MERDLFLPGFLQKFFDQISPRLIIGEREDRRGIEKIGITQATCPRDAF
jgi:hypothetical protein